MKCDFNGSFKDITDECSTVTIKSANEINQLRNAPFIQEIIISTDEFTSLEGFTMVKSVKFDSNLIATSLKLDDKAFSNCLSMTQCLLPKDLAKLPDQAFYNCRSLSNIQLPTNLVEFGSNVFENCVNLSTIAIESSNKNFRVIDNAVYTYNLTTILAVAPGYTGSVTLPKELTSIGDAFKYSKIGSVTINSAISEISNYAFDHCKQLKSVTLNSNINEIGSCSFRYCTSLQSFDFTYISTLSYQSFAYSGLTKIELHQIQMYTWSFYECQELTSVKFDGGVIYDHAFSNCVRLQTLDLTHVTEIQSSAFSRCYSLNEITIPNNMTIDSNAFDKCGYITKVTVDKSFAGSLSAFSKVETIIIPADSAITNFDFLSNLYFLKEFTFPNNYKGSGVHSGPYVSEYKVSESNQDASAIDGVLFAQNGKVLVRFPPNSNVTSYIIPSAVTVIKSQAFANCKHLKEINFENPMSIKTIESLAFSNIPYLTEFILPPEITSIPEKCFADCLALSKIFISSPIVSIENSAFENTAIEAIAFDSNLKTIGEMAFSGCKKLRHLDIKGTSLSIISNGAFAGAGIEEITIPDTATIIEGRAFEQCSNLKTVNIPNSVLRIQEYAFYKCISLTNAIIDQTSNLNFIGDYAFSGCFYLASFNVPPLLTEIGVYAFEKCHRMENLKLPNESNLTYIGEGAFQECYMLTTIPTLPKTVTELPSVVFANCKAITKVFIPSTVTKIGEMAFCSCDNLSEIVFEDGPEELTIDNSAFSQTALKTFPVSSRINPDGLNFLDTMESCQEYVMSGKNPYYFTEDGVLYFKDDDGTSVGFVPCSFPKQTLNFSSLLNGVQDIYLIDLCPIETITFTPSDNNVYIQSIYGKLVKKIIFTANVSPLCDFTEMDSLQELIFDDNCSTFLDNVIFSGLTNLKKVHLPSGITTIPSNCFNGCQSLSDINLDKVKIIESNAFSKCAIKSLSLPLVTEIQSGAFQNCLNLTTISFLLVQQIGDNAFSGCSALKDVTISNVQTIGESAFDSCSLVSNVMINNVKTIGPKAFSGTSIREFSVPATMEEQSIGSIFTGAQSFSSKNAQYTAVDGVLYNKNKTILLGYPSANLAKSFTLPNTVTDAEFISIYALTSLDLGNAKSVTITGLSNLIEITFNPSTLEYIAISDCNSLRSFKSSGSETEESFKSVNGVLYKGKTLFHIPAMQLSSTLTIADGATLSQGVLSGVQYVKTIKFLGDGDGSLSISAFPLLEEIVNIPTGVSFESIEDCPLLKAISVVPNHPELFSHENIIFDSNYSHVVYCQPMRVETDFVIPYTFTSFKGTSKLSQCQTLKTLTLTDIVDFIPDYYFQSMQYIEKFIIGEKITETGAYCFSYCSNLREIEFLGEPEFESFGYSTFTDCTSLKKMIIPKRVSMTPDNFCQSSRALSIVEVHSTLDTFGLATLAETSIEHFELQKSIDSIEQMSFQNGKFKGFTNPEQNKLLSTYYVPPYSPNVTIYLSEVPYAVNGKSAFDNLHGTSVSEYTTSENNQFFSVIDGKAVVEKNMKELLYHAPSENPIVKGLRSISDGAYDDVSTQFSFIPDEELEYIFGGFALSGVTEVHIPKSVKFIDENAFVDKNGIMMANITKVRIADPSRESICSPFYLLESLKVVEVPDPEKFDLSKFVNKELITLKKIPESNNDDNVKLPIWAIVTLSVVSTIAVITTSVLVTIHCLKHKKFESTTALQSSLV